MSLDQRHTDISTASDLEQMNAKVRAATAAEIAAYTGTRGEIVYDTTNGRLVVMDGSTAGGAPAGSSPIAGAEWNMWQFNIKNDAGTIKHFFTNPSQGSAAAQLIGGINGPLLAESNTPTGADGSTAMVAGVKIGSASTNKLIFDTADLTDASLVSMGGPIVTFNSTAETFAYFKWALTSRDVNGVTRTRLELSAFANNGVAVAWNTTNLASTEQISFTVSGVMPDYA